MSSSMKELKDGMAGYRNATSKRSKTIVKRSGLVCWGMDRIRNWFLMSQACKLLVLRLTRRKAILIEPDNLLEA